MDWTGHENPSGTSAPVSIVNPDGTTNRIWLSAYAAGVPADIDLNQYRSLNQYFDGCVQKFQARAGFVSFGTTMRNDRLGRLVEAFAGWLQNNGVKKGDRVAIMLLNTFQYPVSLFAVLRIGAVVVNVNPTCTSRELNHQLRDSGAQTVVLMENFAKTLQDAQEGAKVKRIVLTQAGDLFSDGIFNLKGRTLNLMLRQVQKLVPSYSLPQARWMRETLEQGKKVRVEQASMNREDLAFLQYTCEDEGVAKGAMLTHGNVLASCQQVLAFIDRQVSTEVQPVVTLMPLHHIHALAAGCLVCMAVGGRNILVAKTATLRGHGLAASSPIVMAQPISARQTMPVINGAIGVPLPSTEVRCRRDDGGWASVEELGELCVRGPQVMKGYWQRWDETDRVLDQEGWLATGDIAVMDERGFLRIVDRKKNVRPTPA